MYIRKNTLLQNKEQIKKYNNFKNIVSLGEMRGKEKGIKFFYVWVPLKNDPMDKKYV